MKIKVECTKAEFEQVRKAMTKYDGDYCLFDCDPSIKCCNDCSECFDKYFEHFEPKRWRAETHGTYYFINNSFQVDWANDLYDIFSDNRYKLGNYFQTREQAEKAAEKLREVLKND